MEIYLVTGPAGCGKSTTARGLAMSLKFSYTDDDFTKDAMGFEYKSSGRGLQFELIKSIGESFSSKGAVYAIDWDLDDENDCKFVEKLYRLCKERKWTLRTIFLECDRITEMKNMLRLYESYGLQESECKMMADERFASQYAGRYYPDGEEMKSYCDSYVMVPAGILVAQGVISYILDLRLQQII